MAASDKARLFPLLQELRSQQGKTWQDIEEILEEEGYEEKGETLTANALRKRYTKWSRSEEGIPGKAPTALEPESKQEQGRSDFDRLQKHRMDSALEQFGGGESALAGSPEDAIAGLLALNNQLLEQLRESNNLMQRLEKRIEEQKTTHTGSYTEEQPVTSRDLLELLKKMGAGRQQMRIIEEERKDYVSREEVEQLIEETVQDRIDAELKTMLSEEGGVSQDLARLIDHRLKTLFSGGEPVLKTAHPGPGRGKRGKTHKKFSASLESDLYLRVKSLPGMFSQHLANSLEAYLAVMGKGGDQE